MREDRGLNILQYEKKTQLINSSLDGQEMREGQRSLKGFCDLGLKLEDCRVTHRQDDVAPGKFVTGDSALERCLRSSPPDLEFFKRGNKMKMSQQAGSNPRPQDH